jgi:hypothetical protein
VKRIFLIITLFFLAFALNARAQDSPEDYVDKDPYQEQTYAKARINLGGGLGYRTASVSSNVQPEFRDYVEELKSGNNFGGDIAFFLNDKHGLGLRYSNFMTSNSMGGIILYDSLSGDTLYGSMEDNITIWFIGPMYISRNVFGNGMFVFLGTIEMGMVTFHDEAKLVGIPVDIKGSSLGLGGSLGLDVLLHRNFALGAELRYLIGTISQFEIKSQLEVEMGKESMNRFDLNLGIKFYF